MTETAKAPPIDPSLEALRAERDAVVMLGLLSHMYLSWDPGIVPAGGDAVRDRTHFTGLNIHAALVDNTDGEILAVERNSIHREQNPLEHAEQRAIRSAMHSMLRKKPRADMVTVEQYYRTEMFYRKGSSESDFLRHGCTLYTSLQPCPMCAATALVARIKRVVYLVPDQTFGSRNGANAYDFLKRTYYGGDDVRCERLCLPDGHGEAVWRAKARHDTMLARTEELRARGMRDTHFFDELHHELREMFEAFRTLGASHLATRDSDGGILATLRGLKRACNLPYDPGAPSVSREEPSGVGTATNVI